MRKDIGSLLLISGLMLMPFSTAGAQARRDYSRIANYCPSQAVKLQRPAFLLNLSRIPYPPTSPHYRDRERDHRADYDNRVRDSIAQCESSLARDRYRPWGPQ